MKRARARARRLSLILPGALFRVPRMIRSWFACAFVVLIVACGGSSSTPTDGNSVADAMTDAPTDGGPCVPETDEALCEAAMVCGITTVTDSCGASRMPVCNTCSDCNQTLEARLTAACVALSGANA